MPEPEIVVWPPSARSLNAWVIIIPYWHPPSVNMLLRMNHHAANRAKKAAYEVVAGHVQCARVPVAGRRRGYAVLYHLAPRQRACDPDNYQKVLLDALVHCRMLVDDSRQWCEPLQAASFCRGQRPVTEIYLEDL